MSAAAEALKKWDARDGGLDARRRVRDCLLRIYRDPTCLNKLGNRINVTVTPHKKFTWPEFEGYRYTPHR